MMFTTCGSKKVYFISSLIVKRLKIKKKIVVLRFIYGSVWVVSDVYNLHTEKKVNCIYIFIVSHARTKS